MDYSLLILPGDLKRRRRALLDKAADLMSCATSVRSIVVRERVQTSPDPYVWQRMVDEAHEAESEAAEVGREMQAVIAEITSRLGCLDPRSRRLILMRYVQDRSWKEIASEMGYSVQHVYRLNTAALAAWRDAPDQACPEE